MPTTTRRQSRLGLEREGHPVEPVTVERRGSGVGGGGMGLRLPPTNLIPPNMDLGIDEREAEGDEDVQMGGVDIAPAKVDTPVEGDSKEADRGEVQMAGIESSGHPNEQEITDALYRSDGEDEGIHITEEMTHEEVEEVEMEEAQEAEHESQGEEESSEGGVEIEVKEGDSASESDDGSHSGHSAHSAHSSHSDTSHHSASLPNGDSHTPTQPSFPGPRVPRISITPTTYTQLQSRPSLTSSNLNLAASFSEYTPRTRYRQRYRCAGWNGPCEAENELTDRDTLSCKECGCWGLYKVRTARMVQFGAR
ncbi:hypothetical protein K458DRAFT_396596 [Lentithecium fluviatile CBS 122367]|uniref:Uncharacterized protein n=1 Tax=Lentithecium fluviatile CBS 122367 TaxID=1168545 RepID=A0A6G1IER3_9PLEO|nr:hypothetical protein K458DRAFT_396596 [Lentithecium fluviatile CBS 122367]